MSQTLVASDAPAWYDVIARFDADYAQLYENYNGLMAQGPYIQNEHPEQLDYYMQLLQQGSDVAYKLERIKPTIDYARAWLQWLQTGADNIMIGAQSVYDSAKAALGLGMAPIVALAGIAVIGAILIETEQLLAKYLSAAQRFSMQQSLEAQGVPSTQAVQQVNAALGPVASNEFLGIPWTLLAWGAIAIFLGPPLIDAFAKSRERRYVR